MMPFVNGGEVPIHRLPSEAVLNELLKVNVWAVSLAGIVDCRLDLWDLNGLPLELLGYTLTQTPQRIPDLGAISPGFNGIRYFPMIAMICDCYQPERDPNEFPKPTF